MGRVVVVGAINEDVVMYLERMPEAGETVRALSGLRGGGGKGGNQAVAAARAGSEVVLVASVGADSVGSLLRRELASHGVGVDYVHRCDTMRSGCAIVLVDSDGENRVAVDPGANRSLDVGSVRRALSGCRLSSEDVVLASLEVAPECVAGAFQYAASVGARCIANASPSAEVGDWLWRSRPMIIVNAGEAVALTGAPSPETALRVLAGRTEREVVVTLGGEGALLAVDRRVERVAPSSVKVMDSVGAGDVFAGTVAALAASGRSVSVAVRGAAVAAALSVSQRGARGPLLEGR